MVGLMSTFDIIDGPAPAAAGEQLDAGHEGFEVVTRVVSTDLFCNRRCGGPASAIVGDRGGPGVVGWSEAGWPLGGSWGNSARAAGETPPRICVIF
jgi:hypothetical protein